MWRAYLFMKKEKSEKAAEIEALVKAAKVAMPEKVATPPTPAKVDAPPTPPAPVAPPKPTHRYLSTPDGRYFIARGKLLRCSNPNLSPADREKYSELLVLARKEEKSAKMWGPAEAVHNANRKVDDAKKGLGERGKPWWTDGAPDYSRQRIEDTPYAEWWNKHGGAGKK
ncbi:hypothetical protein BH10PLA1_BH10PLA1_15910 [soil metagenome]